ncbi:MAG TPA: MFS transporter [Phnomibacter sp.]|nr:MFS transporter [Phnomibacter sp.]
MADGIRQGLRENWRQFSLLVLINAFVGAMVGIERTIFPEFAKNVFGIEAAAATLSFIVAFGIVKAFSNYFAGRLANFIGRRNLLILGWSLALPVPFLLLYAPTWNWVIFANVLLGIHQGITWSTNVLMKIELAGEKDRGLAMGLNEFAGYLAVAVAAFVTGWMAGRYGVRPYPFYLGIAIAVIGLLLTASFVRDTPGHALTEEKDHPMPRLKSIVWQTTWGHPNLGTITQAGLMNNLNDGMVWGLLPMWLASKGYTLTQIGWVAAVYPAVWGISQLYTGRLGDKMNKKTLLQWGMWLQGLAILLIAISTEFWQYLVLAAILGWGTAMVYPNFLSGIAENTHPADRPQSLGIFRFWRDMGYAIGALLTGVIADKLGFSSAIYLVGMLTLASGFIIRFRML